VRNAASPRHDRAVHHHEHRTAALSFPPDQRVQRLGHDRREVVEVGVADPAQLVRAAAVGEGCRPLVSARPRDSAEPWAGPPSMGPGSRAGVLACRMPISSSWVWMHRHVPEMRDRDLLIPGRVNRKKKKNRLPIHSCSLVHRGIQESTANHSLQITATFIVALLSAQLRERVEASAERASVLSACHIPPPEKLEGDQASMQSLPGR
jgi:hypothetical protein